MTHTLRLVLPPLALAFAQLAPAPALAHPLAPSHLRIELADTSATLTLTHGRDTPAPVLRAPPHCRVEPIAERLEGESRVFVQRWHCIPAGPLVLTAAAADPPLLVELQRPGTLDTFALDASHPVLDLAPAPRSPLDVLATFTGLGVHHLIGGLDHVLLVLGLVLLIGLRWRMVAALTAFTLGHSVSLALGVTGLVTLPSALVESAIALTLVALALDLATPRARATASLFARAPWLTGTFVGLVHGLGFAGVLHALGLPDEHTALGLVGFNLGLELAQLALVIALAAALLALRRVPLVPPRLAPASGWLIGIIGSAWFFERALAV